MRQDDLVLAHGLALVKGPDLGVLRQDGGQEPQNLSDAAENTIPAGQDLHGHHRVQPLLLQDGLGAGEIDVGGFAGQGWVSQFEFRRCHDVPP